MADTIATLTRRPKWSNPDLMKLATPKQIAYLADLLTKQKEMAKEFSAEGISAKFPYLAETEETLRDTLVAGFWELVELPADLTAWEASKLISLLSGVVAPEALVISSALVVLRKRATGDKLNSDTTGLAWFALSAAMQFLAERMDSEATQ